MAPLSTGRRVRVEYARGRSRWTLVCVMLALLLAVIVAAEDETPTPTPPTPTPTPTFPSDNVGSASITPAPTFPIISPTPAASTPFRGSESSSSDGDAGGPMTGGTSAPPSPLPELVETNKTHPPVAAEENRILPSPTTASVPVDTSLNPSPTATAANASSTAPPAAITADREAALPSPPVSAPYRSEILRCAERECQNEFVGETSGGGGGCVSQLTSGSCPAGFNKGVATSSYKMQVLPNAPNSVADVTFSLLASDIAGALHNVGDLGGTNWWLAFRLPAGWRFVTWGSTTVDVALVQGDGQPAVERQFQVLPCKEITDASNCRDASTEAGDTVGFVAVQDMVGDWAELLSSSVKAPLTFRLEKSVVSGPTTGESSGQVGVFIVYEKRAKTTGRHLSTSATTSSSVIGVSGNLAVVPLANMEAPAITEGRLYSSLLWVEVQKQKATLSFSTSTIIGSKSNEPKVCVNLRPTACSTLGRLPTANATFDSNYMAWYVKDGNPFIGMYTLPGDAPLTVEPVNETFFCVRDLMPSGIDFNKTWEVQQEFKFQLYVKGITWLGSTAQNLSSSSDSSSLPVLAEIMLIDRGIPQGSDCAQIIVHDQPASNHGLSVYSVMSVTIYAVAFVGAVLITRMNGITFSAPTFYNDMTSVCVVVIFLLSIVGNAIWITVSSDSQSTNASHIYYLTRVLTSCFTWTMMTSVCFHWSTVLNHDVRRIRRVYLMLVYITINAAFFACGLFVLISLSDFFKCAYDDYLKNPKYDKRMCDADYCPDLQPFQWKYAASKLCRAVPYSNWYFATAFSTELLMFLASLALLVLGTYVLQRGSRLIEHSGAILDDRIVTVMRNSLKTYLIVILAITMSLGVSMVLNLVLYFGDWSINAIVWYTFTIWLPTLIPPAGFLVLQWNPRLHGISWSNGGGASGPQQPQPIKNRRNTKDEDLKRALGRGNSTLGLLSDGWCGISEFPDTDYLPIGADSCDGSSQQLLTLSAQLVTPVALHHACYMELYVGEPQEEAESEDEFDLDVTGRPRGSINTMIQSGLLRESMIVSHTSNVNRGTRGNSTVLGSMQPTGAVSWNRVGFTETVLPTLAHDDQGVESQVATFMSVIQIPVLPPSAIVRFVVYELPDDIRSPPTSSNAPPPTDQSESRPRAVTDVIRPPSLHTDDHVAHNRVSGLSMARQSRTRAFCEFTCSSTVLTNSEQLRLVAQDGSHRPLNEEQEANAERGGGDVPILRVRTTTVTTRTLKESSSFYITKCFQFAEGDEMVVEDMTESIFTNDIPRQFLELLYKERSADLARAEHDLRAFEVRCQRGLAAGLYDNLIDQIQGENVQTVAQTWLETRVRQRSAYLHSLKQCQQVCVDRAEEGVNFKASTDKKNLQLRFLPINLHIQDMWVGATEDLCSQLTRRTSTSVKLYTGVTVGAFAAHCYKFRHGVGIPSMRARLAKKIPVRSASDRVLLTRIDSGQSDKSGPLASPGLIEQDLDWTETTVRAEDELRWQIVTRMDMCLSQALTALVTSFCRNLEAALQHPSDKEFLHIIDGVGFLWQIESLLSTHGKELGMLEDFSAAVDAMKGVSFVLDTSPPPHLPPTLNLHIKDVDLPSVVSVRLSGDTRSGHFIVYVGIRCRQDVVASLPSGIRDGGYISVTPVLFTQGINEMQTLANGSSGKKTTLQQTINRDSFFALKEYAERYRTFASRVPGVVRTDMRVISSLLSELEDRILSAGKQMVKTKHPKIIQQSSRLCRLLGGGRVTSCKSAKDRTSMSVTLEQGQVLCDFHGLPAEYLARTVSTMRSNGVRLENAFKNTGKRQYAFNALQRSLLPEEYKCPEGTYGRGNVS